MNSDPDKQKETDEEGEEAQLELEMCQVRSGFLPPLLTKSWTISQPTMAITIKMNVDTAMTCQVRGKNPSERLGSSLDMPLQT